MSNNVIIVTAEDIIAYAEKYRKNANRKMNYHDYEAFKRELIMNGHYGYEKQLADALKI